MNTWKRSVALLGGVLLLAGSALAEDWPQWRGPQRDNKVSDFAAPKAWPKQLTKKWKVPVGQGDSSPVLVGDKLYVFGRKGAEEVVDCLDAASGTVVWTKGYKAQPATGPGGGIHAGPRSTPAVADGKVCTLGVRGQLRCLDAATGALAWEKDTGKYPGFFTSSSPLVADGLCVVCLGTDGAGEIAAFSLADGKPKWSVAAGGAPYGSPALMTVDGIKQVVAQMTGAGGGGGGGGGGGKGKGGKGKGGPDALVGVALADGARLWQHTFGSGHNDTTSTPIVDGATLIYAVQGGTLALKIEKKDGKFKAKQLWEKSEGSHKYNTPVLRDGVLYGLTAKGKNSALYCMDAQTGEPLWTDTTTRGECGHVLNVGPVLLALSSDKNLVAFAPDNKGYHELARYKVADTAPWAAPLIAGNRIYVKDQDSLTLWTIE